MASKLKNAAPPKVDELFIPEELLGCVPDAAWRSTWEKASAISIAKVEFKEWQTQTWEFVRMCKAQWPTLSAEEMLDLVPWGETFFDEEDQARFFTEWNKVRCIPGTDPLTWALTMSINNPVNPPSNSPYTRFKNYGRFIGLAAWLQVSVGASPIFLPSRKIADTLGLRDNHTVADMCRVAVRDGLLELVSKHTANRAARYRFKLELYHGPIEKWLSQTPTEGL